jgi:hypothetical protein
MVLSSVIPENICAQNNLDLLQFTKDMNVDFNVSDTLLWRDLDTNSTANTLVALASSSVVLESAVEKDEYLGVNISPMTGLFGISYYDKNGTGFFQDGLIFNGFFKSSWLGYDITYYDLQLLELDKSGFYAGLGVALFYTISESTKVESSIMTGFAWSGGYNIHLGPVFLGIGGHFYNFSSSRWTLNFGFKI